jgi:uncharacterized protein (TIGR02466 family)
MDRQLIQTKLFHSNLYTGEINFPSDLIHNVINLKNSVESVAFSNRGGWQSPSYTSYTSNEFMHSVLVDITEHLIPVYDSYGIDSLPALSNYWFNVNDKFNYNIAHIHPFSYFSGCLYLKVPKNSGELVFNRPDILESTINNNKQKSNENTWARYYITPQPNLLVIFPSYLMHSVESNLTEDEDSERISISFNFT